MYFIELNSPELKSHTRMDLSRPSMSPDKRTFPNGSNFNKVTGALWPNKKDMKKISQLNN